MRHSWPERLILACPAGCGAALIALTFIDHALFRAGVIGARQAIGHELLFFVLGALSSVLLGLMVLYWLSRRRFKTAAIAIVSCALFCLAFYVAAESGSALVYAT